MAENPTKVPRVAYICGRCGTITRRKETEPAPKGCHSCRVLSIRGGGVVEVPTPVRLQDHV
jgi:rubrerythrin